MICRVEVPSGSRDRAFSGGPQRGSTTLLARRECVNGPSRSDSLVRQAGQVIDFGAAHSRCLLLHVGGVSVVPAGLGVILPPSA